MSDSDLYSFIPAPTTTVIICRNKAQTLGHKHCVHGVIIAVAKSAELDGTYIGDVCPARSVDTAQAPKIVEVHDGYGFDPMEGADPSSRGRWEQMPYYSASKSDAPQVLRITPPIPTSSDFNYLSELISTYKSLNELLSNSESEDFTLSSDILQCVFEYLPFMFPIFVCCTSIYRGRGAYTHWTYPYTKSKKWMLDYLKQCEKRFDARDDCHYVSQIYLMSDEAPIDFSAESKKSEWVDQRKDVWLRYKFAPHTFEREWNAPIPIASTQSRQLSQVIWDRNDVGGSYWLTMKWLNSKKSAVPDSEATTEWLNDSIVGYITTRIGGSGGIKSRSYLQTDSSLSGKYLPMNVLSVCCGWKMLQDVVNSQDLEQENHKKTRV